jgi:hypothetical protein
MIAAMRLVRGCGCAFALFFQSGVIAGSAQSLAIAAGMGQNLVGVPTGSPSPAPNVGQPLPP